MNWTIVGLVSGICNTLGAILIRDFPYALVSWAFTMVMIRDLNN